MSNRSSFDFFFFCVEQIAQLQVQVGTARFQDLMQTVDNETLDMLRVFLTPSQLANSLQQE